MIAGTLEVQMLANMARLSDDMGKAKSMVGGAMKSIEGAVASAKSALGALGIGLGVGYFVSLIKGSIDAMDRLHDLSLTIKGLSSETLAGLGVAAKQSGSDLDGTTKSINFLSKNMGANAEEFKKLGITAKDPLEAFKQLSDIFVAIEDPQLRSAVAAKALGKAWESAAPLLAEGGKKIGEMVEQGTKLSKITTEMTRQADELNDKWVLLGGTGGMLASLVGPMLPLLNMLADDMLKVQQNSDGVMKSFDPMAETLRTLILLWGNFSFTFTQFGIAFAGVGAQIAAFQSGGWKEFVETRKIVTKVLLDERAAFDEWEKKVLQIGKNPPVAPGGAMDMGGSGNVFGRNKKTEDAAAAFIGGDKVGGPAAGIGKALQDDMDDQAKILSETAQLTDDFRAKERAAEKATYDQRNQDLIDFYDRQQEVAIENGAKQIAIDKSLADQKKAQQDAELQGRMTFLQNLAGLMNTHSKRAFEVGKAAALVQAGVSGALAVMEAWRSGMQTLGPWAPAVAAAYAAAAAANALNLMNNIRKQEFGGAGGASPVFSAQPGTSIPAAAQGSAPAAPEPGQTTVVNFPEGMRDDDLFSGKVMRAFLKNLEEATRNGGRVVIA